MNNKHVIVTGGSNGIGRAIVRRLCDDEGYVVHNLDRVASETVLSREHFYQINLLDTEALTECIDGIKQKYEVTRLVNNAGASHSLSIDESTVDSLRQLTALNLEVPLLLTQALLPTMRALQFGRVVNISSRTALGKERRSTYSATKAGLIGMTRTWALELGKDGVTVNAIGPGPIATSLFDQVNPVGSAQRAQVLNAIPVQRLGSPEEVAHAVSFFLDERAGFITGQTLYVCGGMTVGLSAS